MQSVIKYTLLLLCLVSTLSSAQESKDCLSLNDDFVALIDSGEYRFSRELAKGEFVNINFDKDGKIASRGKINKKLFEELINNFPENIYPRADDLKVYTEYFFKNFESFKKLPSNDLFRTLTEVTAEMIFKFFVFCERPEKVIFHGGGTLNSFLMERIEKKIEKKLHTTDDFGVPSKYVESAGFAYLAYKKRSEIFFPK